MSSHRILSENDSCQNYMHTYTKIFCYKQCDAVLPELIIVWDCLSKQKSLKKGNEIGGHPNS